MKSVILHFCSAVNAPQQMLRSKCSAANARSPSDWEIDQPVVVMALQSVTEKHHVNNEGTIECLLSGTSIF
jgi:hypothetical protein